MTPLLTLLALALPAGDAPTPGPTPPAARDAAKPDVIWHLTLPEAIRIGLDNAEVVRVVAMGTHGALPAGFTPLSPAVQELAAGEKAPAPTAARPDAADVAIARLNGDGPIWDFQDAIMAHVRSIEQQYWALAQQQATLRARETAVRLGEEILRRERDATEIGRGSPTPEQLAEAERQLESFKLNLVTATSDMVTTERQLRNILGLPAADNRRIVPATAPTEAEVKADWEACVGQMMAHQPAVARPRQLLALAAFRAVADPERNAPTDEQRARNRREVDRQQDSLRLAIHQATHTLSRFSLEVDASHKQFLVAKRLRAAAQARLDAQRAFYEEGRITIDRLLDAIGQYGNAFAQEAQYVCTYNTAIAALEEAKGTLLAFDGITLALESGPSHRGAEPASAPVATPAPPAAATCKVRASVVGIKLLDVEVEVSRPAPPAPE